MVNSPRVSLADRYDVISDRTSEIAAKANHHKGNCHQSGNSSGSKLVSMLAKTIHGSAISMASLERNPRTFSGMTFLLATQNPTMPIPSSTSTDCSTTRKISILCLTQRNSYLCNNIQSSLRKQRNSLPMPYQFTTSKPGLAIPLPVFLLRYGHQSRCRRRLF